MNLAQCTWLTNLNLKKAVACVVLYDKRFFFEFLKCGEKEMKKETEHEKRGGVRQFCTRWRGEADVVAAEEALAVEEGADVVAAEEVDLAEVDVAAAGEALAVVADAAAEADVAEEEVALAVVAGQPPHSGSRGRETGKACSCPNPFRTKSPNKTKMATT
jgi:hypothetical protein